MQILKIILAPVIIALVVFGFYTKIMYKKHKWIDNTDLESKKQAKIETLISLGSFLAGLGLMYVWTIA